MIRLIIVITLAYLILLWLASCNATKGISIPTAPVITPLPANCIGDTATLFYQLVGSFMKADTGGLVVMDTISGAVKQYRLSTGQILPSNSFIFIYNFKNNLPPFPLPD